MVIDIVYTKCKHNTILITNVLSNYNISDVCIIELTKANHDNNCMTEDKINWYMLFYF